MKARVESARTTLSQHVRLSLALIGLAVAVLVLFVPGSHAVSASTPFELDGNVTTDHASAGLPDDWDRVFANSGGSYFSHVFIGGNVEAPGNDQTYFTGGGSKDTHDFSDWNWTPTPTPSAPDKNEITDAMAAAYVDSSDGHTILYFGADRYATNGDSNIGFWFTQQPVGLVQPVGNNPGTFSGLHTNHDLFVLSAFGNGGSAPTITVYEWLNGSLNLLSSGSPCVSSGIACAFVNESATPMAVPWPYTPKSGSAGQVSQNGFFEGGIDLDSLFALNNQDVPCFASFIGETRSSDSTDATLKDLALGNVNSCGSIELKKHWVGPAGSTTLKIGTSAGDNSVASTTVSGADGTTGQKQVKAGDYFVSEDATTLSHYTASLACENDSTDPAGSVTIGANNKVTVNPNDQVVCTFTNTFNKLTPTVTTTLKNAATNATVANGTHLPLGSGVYDTATIAGDGGFPLSGTVTFNFYTSGDCTGSPTAQTGATVTGTSATSNQHLNLTRGSYSFNAQYVAGSDAAHNDSLVSSCEPFVIDQKQLTIGTTIHNANHDTVSAAQALGAVLHDTAQVGGAVNGIASTGAVTFKLFPNGLCTQGTGSTIGTNGTAESNGDPRSVDTSALGAGSWAFQATVAGDTNYIGETSACEPFTVNPANLTLGTTIHGSDHGVVTTSLPLGSVVHDTAQLGGTVNGFTPAHAVTFTFFPNGLCTQGTGSTIATNGTAEANGDARTVATSALGAGSYSFQASIAGDSNYVGKTSDCEPLTIDKAALSLGTTIHDPNHGAVTTSLPLGSVVHDTAQLGGKVDGFTPANGVTFTFFPNGSCTPQTGSPIATNGTAEANGDARTVATSALGVGSYSFQASIAGDTNYVGKTSDCEPLTITKADTSTVTDIHNQANDNVVTQIALGGKVYDSATVSSQNGSFKPTGTVTFTFYTSADCQTGSSAAGSAPVVQATGVASPSDTQGPLAAGSYGFVAHYSGDANFNASTGVCEPLTVNPADTSTVTDIHNQANDNVVTQIALGGSVYDSATVSSQNASFKPTGTVTFTFYNTADCKPEGSSAGSAPVVEATGVASPSATEGPLAAGSYGFVAHYSGDANFNASTGVCEPLTVNPAQLAITTNVHNANHQDVTGGSVGLGSTVHDLSIVTGQVGNFVPSGGVSFVLFSGTDCQVTLNSVSADGTESGNVRSVDVLSLVPGNYGFKATVAGDSNYLGATGACENFSVSQATTTTVTAIHDANHGVVPNNVPLGTTVHDAASVTSDNSTKTPTGNVNFRFFTNSECTGESSTAAGTVALNGVGVADPSDSEGPLAAGQYGFQATYVGDTNFVGSTGACEPLTVDKGTPSTATQLHNSGTDAAFANGTHLPFGSGVFDVATVSNASGFDLTGSVTFQFFNNGTCTGEPVSSESKTPFSGTANSSSHDNLNAGSYSFNAQYLAGNDPNHNDSAVSECEPFVVDKAAPSIATTLSATEVVIGTSVNDTAKLTGASPNAGGSVTYTVFDNNQCTVNANTRDAGTVAVTNGSVPNSNSLLFNTAGDFYWQAVYGGDANNLGATSPCTSEHLLVDKPAIAITKNPATQAVDSGGTANFTITVTNTGSVTLTNVTVTDPLSSNCNKSLGTLTPGQSTTYTCNRGGVTAAFTNVATVTGHPPVGPDVTASASANVTVNPPPPPPTPPTPTPTVDLQIVKTASPTTLLKGGNVTYTLSVKNNGPVTDTAVQVADSLPVGVTYVSATSTQGTCTGTAVVQCNIGTMTNGQTVTITIVVNAVQTGTIVNTATVVGALPETTLTNNTSSASITVNAPPTPKPKPKPVFKPPVVKPKPKPVPPACYAVLVAPKSLTVGKASHLQFQVTAKNKGIHGVKVEVKGAGILKLSGRTDASGKVTLVVHPKKPGIVLVKPASYKGCANPRIGVVGAFTPPVTG